MLEKPRIRPLESIERRRTLLRFGGASLAAALGLVFPVTSVLSKSLAPVRCPEVECGHLYDPAVGEPDQGIPPGVPFEDLPDDWECPECGTPKSLW